MAAEVALHQSTLSRVAEKLEKQNLVQRRRLAHNQRSVEVHITEAGRKTYELLDDASSQMISDLLDNILKQSQVSVVEALEEVAEIWN